MDYRSKGGILQANNPESVGTKKKTDLKTYSSGRKFMQSIRMFNQTAHKNNEEELIQPVQMTIFHSNFSNAY